MIQVKSSTNRAKRQERIKQIVTSLNEQVKPTRKNQLNKGEIKMKKEVYKNSLEYAVAHNEKLEPFPKK